MIVDPTTYALREKKGITVIQHENLIDEDQR
jgi:hypothetical protein